MGSGESQGERPTGGVGLCMSLRETLRRGGTGGAGECWPALDVGEWVQGLRVRARCQCQQLESGCRPHGLLCLGARLGDWGEEQPVGRLNV